MHLGDWSATRNKDRCRNTDRYSKLLGDYILDQEPAKFVRKTEYHGSYKFSTSCSLSCASTNFSKEVAYPSPTRQNRLKSHSIERTGLQLHLPTPGLIGLSTSSRSCKLDTCRIRQTDTLTDHTPTPYITHKGGHILLMCHAVMHEEIYHHK